MWASARENLSLVLRTTKAQNSMLGPYVILLIEKYHI